MCASVSHESSAVINDASKGNPISSEPPGRTVQTNLANHSTDKTKHVEVSLKASVPKLPTKPTIMGNQQGSEGGKNQQGSKKKEKKDNSKSNSPNGETSLRKSKSPSVKSKTSPASPGKKLFRRKQQSAEKQKTKDNEPPAAGACSPDQQSVQDVFTDACDTVEGSGQVQQQQCEKVVCDSSSDNISFESVSCATPLRVATPSVHRAKPPSQVSPGDRVDELGKSIERTILERFSDGSSNTLETKSKSTESVGNNVPANKQAELYMSVDMPPTCDTEQKPLIKSVTHIETEQKTRQEAGTSLACVAIPTSNQQPSGMQKSPKVVKPVRKIKIEHSCTDSKSKTISVEETVRCSSQEKITEPTKSTDDVIKAAEVTNNIVALDISEMTNKSASAIDNASKFAEATKEDNASVIIPEQIDSSTAVPKQVSSLADEDKVIRHPVADERVSDSVTITKDEKQTEKEIELGYKSIVMDETVIEPANETGQNICSGEVVGKLSESTTATKQNSESGVVREKINESVDTEIKDVIPHSKIDSSSDADIQTAPSQPTDGPQPVQFNKPSGSADLETVTNSAEIQNDTDTILKEGNTTQIDIAKSIVQTLAKRNETASEPETDTQQGKLEVLAETTRLATTDGMLRGTEAKSATTDCAEKESSEGSPPVNTLREDQPGLTRLFISESDILTDSESCGTIGKRNDENVNNDEKIEVRVKSVPDAVSPQVVKRGDLLSHQSASVDRTFMAPSNRQATLAEKRQHRLTDPLVDTLLLLIKQTMESDNADDQGQKTQSVTTKQDACADKAQIEGSIRSVGSDKEDTVECDNIDKTLTQEDMVEFERLKTQASSWKNNTSIGGMDDDTLTQEDLAEFDRLKKQMSKSTVDTDNRTDEDFHQHSEDRFDLSSGETTEDSVIEKPLKKTLFLAATQEEEIPEPIAGITACAPAQCSVTREMQPTETLDYKETFKPESPVVKKRSLTEDEIRREIRRFMIPEMKEALPNGGSMKQMLNDLHDITPTSESFPSFGDDGSQTSPERESSSGLRSRTSITSSELDMSEQRDDMSTDSMYADDEDDSASEVLFCKTYTEPVRGTEVLVSCTVVNSALKEANSSSDEFWADNSAAEEAYQQVEFAAAAVNRHFTHARSQMQDIQHHLQALKCQMQDMEKQVVKPHHLSSDEFAYFDDPERRAITD